MLIMKTEKNNKKTTKNFVDSNNTFFAGGVFFPFVGDSGATLTVSTSTAFDASASSACCSSCSSLNSSLQQQQ